MSNLPYARPGDTFAIAEQIGAKALISDQVFFDLLFDSDKFEPMDLLRLLGRLRQSPWKEELARQRSVIADAKALYTDHPSEGEIVGQLLLHQNVYQHGDDPSPKVESQALAEADQFGSFFSVVERARTVDFSLVQNLKASLEKLSAFFRVPEPVYRGGEDSDSNLAGDEDENKILSPSGLLASNDLSIHLALADDEEATAMRLFDETGIIAETHEKPLWKSVHEAWDFEADKPYELHVDLFSEAIGPQTYSSAFFYPGTVLALLRDLPLTIETLDSRVRIALEHGYPQIAQYDIQTLIDQGWPLDDLI